ncbi:hypothetical protein P691DRAFT_764257 [Macrolepiota fuliginosa MF-IS2]|uniref:Uncharacterized protein n=1 Tax=Macrolepiota fuliginosa MF-IS2 TaxID=1400762 RepID=A0A9P5X4Y5_9AGAR|nr:hypothetical protein P691DRAFT_764257 [Macrolepiota fuliginosa MF-IS2]
MDSGKRARDEHEQLDRRVRLHHQSREQAQPNTLSEDLELPPDSSYAELPEIDATESSREPISLTTEDFRPSPQTRKEVFRPAQVSVPTVSQTVHLPQQGSSLSGSYPESSMVVTVAHLGGWLPEARVFKSAFRSQSESLPAIKQSTSSPVETLRGRLQASILVSSQASSRSSLSQGHLSRSGNGGVFSGALKRIKATAISVDFSPLSNVLSN